MGCLFPTYYTLPHIVILLFTIASLWPFAAQLEPSPLYLLLCKIQDKLKKEQIIHTIDIFLVLVSNVLIDLSFPRILLKMSYPSNPSFSPCKIPNH